MRGQPLDQEAEFLHPIAEGVDAEVELLGRLRLVAFGDLQRLADQLALDILDVDPLGGDAQVEGAAAAGFATGADRRTAGLVSCFGCSLFSEPGSGA